MCGTTTKIYTGVRLFIRYIMLTLPACLALQYAAANKSGQAAGTDSWKQVSATGQGTITCLWYPIEPFIYRNPVGELCGLEYDLMEGLKAYVKDSLGIQLQIRWVNAGQFEKIYPLIKGANESGLFGLSYYSITPERRREVAFSPPYMPDLNVLCTHPALPNYNSLQDFALNLPGLKAYTMKHTTMEEDVLKLKQILHLDFEVSNEMDDYDILKAISNRPNSFGYVPLSVYVVALQRGIKIKRQVAMGTSREGLAAIMPLKSDWQQVINAYFLRPNTKKQIDQLTAKYLGSEVSDIVLKASLADSLRTQAGDMELLIKEREMVTSRLVETALEVARRKQQNVLATIIFAGLAILLLVLYSRYRVKQKLSLQLKEQNQLITRQYHEIAAANTRIELKMLQAQLNPDFLYNSLNAIQYFVVQGSSKTALTFINRFSVFLRTRMACQHLHQVTAVQEADLLDRYLWLEKERFAEKFVYRVSIPEPLSPQYVVPPLLSLLVAGEVLHSLLATGTNTTPLQLHVNFLPTGTAMLLTLEYPIPATANQPLLHQQVTQRVQLLNTEGSWKIKYTTEEKPPNRISQIIIEKLPQNEHTA